MSDWISVRERVPEVFKKVLVCIPGQAEPVTIGKLMKHRGNQSPMYILDLVRADLPNPIKAKLTQRQWRLIRFALERAEESI